MFCFSELGFVTTKAVTSLAINLLLALDYIILSYTTTYLT